jgi:uncharacterized protein (DUF58 family)
MSRVTRLRAGLVAGVAICAVAAAPRAQLDRPAPAPAGLSVMLLMDASASMTRTQLAFDPRYAQVFNAFLLGLRPQDRGAVGLIGSTTHFTAMRGDHRALAADVRALFRLPDSARLGPSPLWDAIDEAIPLVVEPNGKPAIVIFTDGKSGGNRKGLDEVIDHAKRRGVSVSSVAEGPGSMLQARMPIALDPADALDTLAQATGGRRFVDRPMNPRQRDPGPMISLIMEGLHRN